MVAFLLAGTLQKTRDLTGQQDSAGLVGQLGEDGVESLRALIRENPLAALAAAAAVGLLIARLAR